jgi:hypothetical protein
MKNVGTMMAILANAERTKNPIKFVYDRKIKTYFKPEYAPKMTD